MKKERSRVSQYPLTLWSGDEPDQPEAMTCESLDYLVGGGYQLLSNLKIAQHDVELTKSGNRLIFALDFSELFTFLWPEKSQRSTRHVCYELLSSEHLDFTVPPGALVELVRHLRRLAASNKAAEAKMSELLRMPFVHAFMEHFERSEADVGLSVAVKALQAIRAELPELSKLSILLSRLDLLEKRARVLSFASLVDEEDEDMVPDPEVLQECMMSLSLRRAGEHEINNFVDAYNYALIWSLSNAHVHTRGDIYLLTTSSRIPYAVFRRILWGRFPDTIKDPDLPELSLVRHPIQVLYFEGALRAGKRGERELRYMIAGLAKLLRKWAEIPKYRSYLRGQEKPTSVVDLPTTKRWIEKYLRFRASYQELYSWVRTATVSDQVHEENIRRLRHVGTWAVGDGLMGEISTEGRPASIRLLHELFDRATTVTLASLKRFEQHLAALPTHVVEDVDVEGIVVRRKRLRLMVADNERFDCAEVTALLDKTGERYFSADLYQGYYAIWWSTKSTFAEFLQGVRWFMANASASGDSSGAAKKHFDGIYLYLEGDQIERVPLQDHPELDPDEVLEAAEMKMIAMVRVATRFGDFCYQFRPPFGHGRKAGLISHLPDVTQWLALLVRHTHMRRVGFPELRENIAKCLAKFEGGENR